MDQNDQRDYAEEAANRAIDQDEVVDFADFEYQVDSDEVDERGTVGSIERISVDEMNVLMESAKVVHFVDGDDAVKTVMDDCCITVILSCGTAYAISIDYIRAMLRQINQI